MNTVTPTGESHRTAALVNDDLTQRCVLDRLLSKMDLELREFANAESFLDALGDGFEPDLVVTDLYMPGIDGWQLCRLLRSPDYRSLNDTPILVISATFSGEEPDRITADLGANAFLPQPVDPGRLLDTVEALLRNEVPVHEPSVLVVEDDKNMRRSLGMTFKAQGYRVDLVATGREALAMLDPDAITSGEGSDLPAYHVAVVDYHLPDMDGDVLLERLTRLYPSCAVVMMTGDTNFELALKWMKGGAAAYVRKPFHPQYLVELCAKARRERALLQTERVLEARTRDLRKSEEFNEALFYYSPSETIVVDRHGRIVRWNMAKANSQCCQPVVGDRMYVDYASRHEIDMRGELMACIAARKSRTFPMRPYDGKVWSIKIVPFPASKPEGALIISEDIADQINADHELRRQRDRAQRYLDIANVMFLAFDTEGVITMVNRKGCEILGYPASEIVGKNWFDSFLSPDARKSVRDVVRDLTEGDKSAARPENRVLTRSGEERLIAWSNVCLFDEQGRVTGHLSSGQDVTQQRAAESQARQSQKLESIGTLASGVAHEINNPINGVMNYAQLIKDRAGNGGAGLEEFADEIIKDANRVARIVRNLLAFARREKGTRAPAGMKEIVEDAISLTGAALRRDQIKVSMNIPEELPDLMCHAQQLEQVAVNLLMNARDALNSKYYGGDEQKTITVAVIPVEKEWVEGKSDGKAGVRLTVEDHGTGISESVRARMFDPFFTTKPRGKGTGLGLSILHGIVEEHGGRISVESEEGEWTRFHVDLPL